MGKHEDKDKAEQQRKIDSNGLIRTGRFRIKIPVASTARTRTRSDHYCGGALTGRVGGEPGR
jgi:hypothetical protein